MEVTKLWNTNIIVAIVVAKFNFHDEQTYRQLLD